MIALLDAAAMTAHALAPHGNRIRGDGWSQNAGGEMSTMANGRYVVV
jgi:hypothetical protein